MSCYCPMLARPDGRTVAGKVHYKFVGRYNASVGRDGTFVDGSRLGDVVVPCGQCIGCRLDRSRDWANRMMMEMEYHDTAYFLTLTYDDAHVPVHQYYDDQYVDPDTGEVLDGIKFYDSLSLEPKHMTDFFKRLRRQQEYHFGNKGIMYFLCGEYGSKTMRPHYHAIVYDLILPDLVPFGRSAAGNFLYYRSAILEKLWPYGYVGVANVSWETCAYVARYILKKQTGQNAGFYGMFNVEPEFVRMSLKPAIGLRYYEDHKDQIFDEDSVHFCTAMRGITCKPPSYFDKLYDLERPSRMSEIRSQRIKSAHNAMYAQLVKDNRDLCQLLADKYLNQLERSKKLKRSLEL